MAATQKISFIDEIIYSFFFFIIIIIIIKNVPREIFNFELPPY